MLDTWGGIIAILIGLGAILKAIHTYIFKPIMEKIKKKKTRDEKLDAIIDTVAEIKNQFFKNGGSTIKDQLNRMEIRQLFNDQTSKLTVDALGVGLWQSNELGLRTDNSPSLCKILGRSESELRGNNWKSWIHPDDRDRVINEWMRCVASQSEFSVTYKFITRDNNIINLESHASPVIDNIRDRFVGFIGIVTKN